MWSTNTSSSLIPRLLHQAQIILEQDLAWLRPTPITKSETSSYTGGLMASWRTVFTASMGKHFFRDEFWLGLFILRSLYSVFFLFYSNGGRDYSLGADAQTQQSKRPFSFIKSKPTPRPAKNSGKTASSTGASIMTNLQGTVVPL